MLTLMLPDCRIFLDVDNLQSVALLETYVEQAKKSACAAARSPSPAVRNERMRRSSLSLPRSQK